MEKEKREEKGRYERIYEAYQKLPSLSYELIVKTLGIREWLKEAYEVFRDKPTMSSEEMYARWKDNFDKIYENLFSIFYRPYRMIAYPLALLGRGQSREFTPKSLFDIQMDLFRMGGETQSRLAEGLVSAYEETMVRRGKEGEKPDVTSQMRELRPTKILKNIAKEEMEAYFEIWDRYIEWWDENQFLLPKSFFSHLRVAVSNYSKILQNIRAVE